MNESHHTPGPWAMSPDAVPDGHVQVTIYAEESGERVATAFAAPANAALIAAAPDLLEACEEVMGELVVMLRMGDGSTPLDYAYERMREAIRKATEVAS